MSYDREHPHLILLKGRLGDCPELAQGSRLTVVSDDAEPGRDRREREVQVEVDGGDHAGKDGVLFRRDLRPE